MTASVTVSRYAQSIVGPRSSNTPPGTWNSLGQDLSEKKLLDALDRLAANHIHVSNLIIDDNWQSIEQRGEGLANRRWIEFEAEPKHFPNGLKGAVDHIREKHPHINRVAVWHALFGKDTRGLPEHRGLTYG